MTENSPLEQTVCLKNCFYYKPGKNEEFACKGYLVVERLLREGKRLVLEGNSGGPNPVLADTIVNTLCIACDFHNEDCDFMQDRSARPCGGFEMLSQLLRSGVITMEDIK